MATDFEKALLETYRRVQREKQDTKKGKKRRDPYSDEESGDDEPEPEPGPAVILKKTKSEIIPDKKPAKTKEVKLPKPKPSTNHTGKDGVWQIGENLYVKVSIFKGRLRINIREFFGDPTGEFIPSKKGICLSVAEWGKLESIATEVGAHVKKTSDERPNRRS